MSIYTDLVGDKNKFLDYLIDKYNENPKDGKREFILYYLDKCSFFKDAVVYADKEQFLYTNINNIDVKYIQEISINDCIEGKLNQNITIISVNNLCFKFTIEEYKRLVWYYKPLNVFDLEPWINNEHDINMPYIFSGKIKDNFINNSKKITNNNENVSDDYVKLDIKRKELIVLASRPCMGKTSIAINITLNEIRNGGTVLYLTINDVAEKIGERMLKTASIIPYKDIKENEFTDGQYKRIIESMNKLNDVYIVECNYYNIKEIKNVIDTNTFNPTMIVIDDFEYIHYDEHYPKTDEEIEDIAKELKELARKHDASIVVTAKVSKNVDKRKNKRPKLKDLKAKKLGEMADKIYFIYRDSYYKYSDGDSEDYSNDAFNKTLMDKLEIIDVKEKKTITCIHNTNNIIQ